MTHIEKLVEDHRQGLLFEPQLFDLLMFGLEEWSVEDVLSALSEQQQGSFIGLLVMAAKDELVFIDGSLLSDAVLDRIRNYASQHLERDERGHLLAGAAARARESEPVQLIRDFHRGFYTPVELYTLLVRCAATWEPEEIVRHLEGRRLKSFRDYIQYAPIFAADPNYWAEPVQQEWLDKLTRYFKSSA